MRILVLGGGGMLGHKVVQRLMQRTPDLWWTLRGSVEEQALSPVPELRGEHALQHVDASRLDALDSVIRDLRPQAVVNCLGVIKQRVESSAALPSITINALLPHRVAHAIQKWGARCIHISTDCVFSGRRGAYTEDDEPDATDLYGRSKALGEIVGENVLTLRTSMIGRELRHHQSLLDWFLSQRKMRIRGYRNAIWSGVTTIHLAGIIDTLLQQHPRLTGVYHVSSGRISKFALLRELQHSYDLDVDIAPDDSVHCDRSLVGARFEAAIGYRCPPLPELIRELVADPTPYPVLS